MLAITALLYMVLGTAPQFALTQEAQAGSSGGSACVELTRLNEGRAAPGAEEVVVALSRYLRQDGRRLRRGQEHRPQSFR